MLIKIYPENPNLKDINKVVDCLKKGGIIIYPTDTIYGIGCDIRNQNAVERISNLLDLNKKNVNFTIICNDLSHISEFTKPFSNSIFKILKKTLPGPYTYILEANKNVPKLLQSKKNSVGIRVPDNAISRLIVQELGCPILSKSLKDKDQIIEYITDPELIYEKYSEDVDIIIDGGYGSNIPSTVVSFLNNEIEIIREGKGYISNIL